MNPLRRVFCRHIKLNGNKDVSLAKNAFMGLINHSHEYAVRIYSICMNEC